MKYKPWSKGENRKEDTKAVSKVDIILSGGIIPQQKEPHEKFSTENPSR